MKCCEPHARGLFSLPSVWSADQDDVGQLSFAYDGEYLTTVSLLEQTKANGVYHKVLKEICTVINSRANLLSRYARR